MARDSEARMGVLKEIRKMAMDDMGMPLKGGLKKVTVASPTEEGLEEGLDKAEEIVGEMPKMDEGEEEKGYDEEAEAKLQELVDMCKSPEDLDKKIAFLQQAKEEKFGNSEEEMPEEMGSEEEMV